MGGISEEVKGEDWNVEESRECLQKTGVRTDNTGTQEEEEEEESGKTLNEGTLKRNVDWTWRRVGYLATPFAYSYPAYLRRRFVYAF